MRVRRVVNVDEVDLTKRDLSSGMRVAGVVGTQRPCWDKVRLLGRMDVGRTVDLQVMNLRERGLVGGQNVATTVC